MSAVSTQTERDFRSFVLARQRALLRTAWLLTGNWATAEDVVQTALVLAWPQWWRVSVDGSVEAYVRRILVNTSLDWRRRRWLGEVPTEVLPERASPAGSGVETHQVVLVALRSLPSRQPAAVVLRYFDDLSEADTAVALGCSVGTVKSSTSKALARLRLHPALVDLELQGTS